MVLYGNKMFIFELILFRCEYVQKWKLEIESFLLKCPFGNSYFVCVCFKRDIFIIPRLSSQLNRLLNYNKNYKSVIIVDSILFERLMQLFCNYSNRNYCQRKYTSQKSI